jgi:hypothetical protein
MLTLIVITVFVSLGMSLMPALALRPWSADGLVRGMHVFVRVPDDSLATFPVPGRPAILQSPGRTNSAEGSSRCQPVFLLKITKNCRGTRRSWFGMPWRPLATVS